MFYLLVYGLATVGAFAVVTLVRETAPVRERVAATVGAGAGGADGSDAADNVTDGSSLGARRRARRGHPPRPVGGSRRRSPWLAGVFSLFLLSMAGIPLTAGFVAKFTAFGAAIAGPDGQGGGSTWVLAVVGVLASAVAVFFYVRLIVLMFFTAPSGGERDAADGGADASEGTGVTVVRSTGPTTVAIAVCAIGVLLLGVFPSRFSIWRPRRLSSSRDLRASRPLRARRARGPRERTAP